MSTFSITCTTCNCRLRVRDESLIGQILSCPKCDSMVMVEPPAGYQPSGDETSDPAFYDQETVDDLDSPLHQQRVAEQVRESHESVTSSERVFRSDDEVDPMLPGGQWVSEASQKNRRKLLIVVGGVGTLALLIIVIMLFAGGSKDPVATSDPKNNEAVEDKDGEKDPPSKDGSDTVKKKADGTKSNGVDKDGTTGVGTKDGPVKKDQTQKGPAKKDSKNELVTKKSTQETSKNNTAKKNVDQGTKKKNTEDKGKGETTQTPPGLADTKKGSGEASAAELTKALKEFGPIISNPSFDSATRTAELRTRPPRVAIPRPAPRRVDVQRRLADKFLGIEYTDVPLGSFLRDLTNFSTIPFTLDPLALQANRVTPRSKVNVTLKDGTIEEALAEALKPHRLGYMVDPKGHVVITWPGQDGPNVLSEARYRIDDLVTDDASRTVLQQMIKELISPGGWADAIDDDGATLRFESSELVVKHSRAEHFRLAVFLDKLRKARGLTPQNGFPRLALLTPRTTQILPKLSKPASFKFRYDTPLHDVLQAIGKAGDLDVIVNWQAAASVGWGPKAETTLLVDDRLVSNAFSNVLEPMDLTIRVLDAGSVEVTTWDQMAHQLDIEAYAVGHVATPKTADEWVTALKTKLAATTRSSRSRRWAFFYDEQSKHLFVRAPQVQHIRLSKILAPRP